jgi:hypothetical protein
MGPPLHVDTAGLSVMGGRWRALAGDLSDRAEPLGEAGLACQASAAAVRAGHGEVTAGTAALEERLSAAAAWVETADARYAASEVESAATLAAAVAV